MSWTTTRTRSFDFAPSAARAEFVRKPGTVVAPIETSVLAASDERRKSRRLAGMGSFLSRELVFGGRQDERRDLARLLHGAEHARVERVLDEQVHVEFPRLDAVLRRQGLRVA